MTYKTGFVGTSGGMLNTTTWLEYHEDRMLKIEKIEYKGWQNCYQMTNDIVELIALADVGPRIIRFGFVGGKNQFVEIDGTLGLTGGDEWRLYGGHRLWHAPEAHPRTYYPDNTPVPVRVENDRLLLSQEVEQTTGVKKEIEIFLDPSEARVEIHHRLLNKNLWPIEIAPWALTVMAPGGKAIAPLPPRGPHSENLLPTGSIALWAYTNMADPRWYWGNQYVFLSQDPANPAPQKVGFNAVDGWVGHLNAGVLFLKLFEHDSQANYPDRKSNLELFTNEQILELETLGGLVSLAPGAYVTHKETWLLKKDVGPIESEADAQEVLSQIL